MTLVRAVETVCQPTSRSQERPVTLDSCDDESKPVNFPFPNDLRCSFIPPKQVFDWCRYPIIYCEQHWIYNIYSPSLIIQYDNLRGIWPKNRQSISCQLVKVLNPRSQQIVQGGWSVGSWEDGVEQATAWGRPERLDVTISQQGVTANHYWGICWK